MRGKYVNVPPRVRAAMYKCLFDDVANLARTQAGFIVIAAASTTTTTTKSHKKHATAVPSLAYTDFEDDCFAAHASAVVPLTTAATKPNAAVFRLVALHLDAAALAAAIADIQRLANL